MEREGKARIEEERNAHKRLRGANETLRLVIDFLSQGTCGGLDA